MNEKKLQQKRDEEEQSVCEFCERIIKNKNLLLFDASLICLYAAEVGEMSKQRSKSLLWFFFSLCPFPYWVSALSLSRSLSLYLSRQVAAVFRCAKRITRSGVGMHELFLFVFIRLFSMCVCVRTLQFLPSSIFCFLLPQRDSFFIWHIFFERECGTILLGIRKNVLNEWKKNTQRTIKRWTINSYLPFANGSN